MPSGEQREAHHYDADLRIYDCTPHFAYSYVFLASRYTGKERDTESGLDYFPARSYASTMGRFMSPDPGWLIAADLANPQTLNAYSYVTNSPLIYDDPTGMWGCDDAGTAPTTTRSAGAIFGAIGSFFRNVGCAIANLGSNNSNSSTSSGHFATIHQFLNYDEANPCP